MAQPRMRIAPIFVGGVEPGASIERRMISWDELIEQVKKVDRDVLREKGQRTLTKGHWRRYHEMVAKCGTLASMLQKATDKLEAGGAELAGLRPGDDGLAGANNGRVERILSQKRAAPEYLINEPYALILHDQKSLDPIRAVSPAGSRVLFNKELQPLRDRVETLERELRRVKRGNDQDKPIDLDQEGDDELTKTKKALAAEKAMINKLRVHLAEINSEGPQRILATQLQEEQTASINAIAESSLDKHIVNAEINELRASLSGKIETIEGANWRSFHVVDQEKPLPVEDKEGHARKYVKKQAEGVDHLDIVVAGHRTQSSLCGTVTIHTSRTPRKPHNLRSRRISGSQPSRLGLLRYLYPSYSPSL